MFQRTRKPAFAIAFVALNPAPKKGRDSSMFHNLKVHQNHLNYGNTTKVTQKVIYNR